jgi:hypothetical protein
VNKLDALRGPGESYSNVIVRLFVARVGQIDELLRIVDRDDDAK